MGPKKPAVSDLAAVALSEDELKEAREALKKLDGAELKRQKANMAYWLKSRGQEKSGGVRGVLVYPDSALHKADADPDEEGSDDEWWTKAKQKGIGV